MSFFAAYRCELHGNLCGVGNRYRPYDERTAGSLFDSAPTLVARSRKTAIATAISQPRANQRDTIPPLLDMMLVRSACGFIIMLFSLKRMALEAESMWLRKDGLAYVKACELAGCLILQLCTGRDQRAFPTHCSPGWVRYMANARLLEHGEMLR